MSQISNPFEKFQSLKTIPVTDEKKLKSMYEELLLMDISNEEKILNFQRQRDAIEKHNVTEWAESYYLMTTDVASSEKKKRLEHLDQVISPINKEYGEKLNKKFLESSAAQKLKAPYDILRRNQKAEVEIFRTENIELNKKIDEIGMELTELLGKQTVRWKGEDIPLPMLAPHLKSSDRQVRKEAYEASLAANVAIADIIDEKFDQLLNLRQKIAKNAGFENYTKYRFKELQRFDWGESHCFEFHQAVKKFIVPIQKKLIALRKKNLNLNTVRPYDTGVDINGNDPLRLYEIGDSESMIEGAGKIIKAIDSELYEYFCEIRKNKLFDLDSRENKAPGGYMVMYPTFNQTSVFNNGSGLAHDLMVLLHELGHCFHYFLGKDIEPYALQNWTSEVAESGSMSMEYIGLEEMGHYLDKEKCQRIKEDKLRGIINLFATCARGDEFQHWLYANPGHSPKMRRDKWKELTLTYFEGMNFEGYIDQVSMAGWQFPHILQMPYYLIDYSISEILALTVWDRYKKDPVDGITRYKNGCRTGMTKTVTDIYEIFGTKLSFGEEVLGPLAKRLEAELGI